VIYLVECTYDDDSDSDSDAMILQANVCIASC